MQKCKGPIKLVGPLHSWLRGQDLNLICCSWRRDCRQDSGTSTADLEAALFVPAAHDQIVAWRLLRGLEVVIHRLAICSATSQRLSRLLAARDRMAM